MEGKKSNETDWTRNHMNLTWNKNHMKLTEQGISYETEQGIKWKRINKESYETEQGIKKKNDQGMMRKI